MKFEFLNNKKTIRFFLENEKERSELFDFIIDNDVEDYEEFFQSITCNSDLKWIQPEDVGALTDAPIIALTKYNDDETLEVSDYWAFRQYETEALLNRLIHNGEVFFS